jgi:hypothetical protein
MNPYSVYIREGALAAMPKSTAARNRIMTFLRQLGDNPFHPGHYVETDAIGRPNEVEIIGRYAVTYWADHAAREVKILDIQPAD